MNDAINDSIIDEEDLDKVVGGIYMKDYVYKDSQKSVLRPKNGDEMTKFRQDLASGKIIDITLPAGSSGF